MRREDFEAARERIESLSTIRHAHLVEGVIKWARPSRILEIGAYQGYVSSTIARATLEVGHGHLIILDNFHDYRSSQAKLDRNLRSTGAIAGNPSRGGTFEILRGTSENEHVTQIDMAVIDANHTYEWCKRDTELAIASGAWILMWHDSHAFEGVRMVLNEIRERDWNIVELPFDAGYALGIQRFDAGPAEVPMEKSYL